MLSSSFFCSSFCECRHPPRDETGERERRKSLSLLLLGDSRVFSVVLFSLEIETKRGSDVRKKNWREREGRKSFRARGPSSLSLFSFLVVVLSRVKKFFSFSLSHSLLLLPRSFRIKKKIGVVVTHNIKKKMLGRLTEWLATSAQCEEAPEKVRFLLSQSDFFRSFLLDHHVLSFLFWEKFFF